MFWSQYDRSWKVSYHLSVTWLVCLKALSVKTRKADDVQSCLSYQIFNLVWLAVLCHNYIYERFSVVGLVCHRDLPDHRWLWLFVSRWTAQLVCWVVMQVETASDTTNFKSLTQFTLEQLRRIMTDCSLSTPSSTTCHKPLSPSFLLPSWNTVMDWVPGSTLRFHCFLLRIPLKEQTNTSLPWHISISGKYSFSWLCVKVMLGTKIWLH